MADLTKGSRVTGAERAQQAADLRKRYDGGASIRSLAESTGRSLRARMTLSPPVLAGLQTGDRRTRRRAPVSDRPVVGLLAELSLPC